jgi:hypothetical protein
LPDRRYRGVAIDAHNEALREGIPRVHAARGPIDAVAQSSAMVTDRMMGEQQQGAGR